MWIDKQGLHLEDSPLRDINHCYILKNWVIIRNEIFGL